MSAVVEKIRLEGIRVNGFPLRLYYLQTERVPDPPVISVPKKLFKRAVKRNLLRRRIKEAYRRVAAGYPHLSGKSILIVYVSNEELDYESIRSALERILGKVK